MDCRKGSQVCAKGLKAVVASMALLQSWACSLAATNSESQGLVAPATAQSVPLASLPAAARVAKQLASPALASSVLASPMPAVTPLRDRPWPLSYTVELDSGGALRADGKPLAGVAELESASRAAAGNGSFATAVFFAAPGISAQQRTAVTKTLVSSGFTQVRVVGRAAPRRFWETSALNSARQSRPQPVRRVAAGSQSKSAVAPASQSVGQTAAKRPVIQATVIVKTVGLHVGGGARNEASRQRLVRRFEGYFPGLATCHKLAGDQKNNASFGIDVYVPAAGGSPKLGQIRTRLRSKQFRRCMQKKFRAMVFSPPESGRRTAVSFSLLFKPVAMALP